MAKSIFFTDEAYQKIIHAAQQCGFRVSRGRSSQIALFVLKAAENQTLSLVEKDKKCEEINGKYQTTSKKNTHK